MTGGLTLDMNVLAGSVVVTTIEDCGTTTWGELCGFVSTAEDESAGTGTVGVFGAGVGVLEISVIELDDDLIEIVVQWPDDHVASSAPSSPARYCQLDRVSDKASYRPRTLYSPDGACDSFAKNGSRSNYPDIIHLLKSKQPE